jgi:hypothetical protein
MSYTHTQFLFYFVVFFIMVRVWVLLIESDNAYVIAVGAAITFLLIFSICFRCRLAAMAGEGGLIMHDNVDNPAHMMYRNAQGGLSDEMIEMLHCYAYSGERTQQAKTTEGELMERSSNALLPEELIEEVLVGGANATGLSGTVADSQAPDRHWGSSGCSICLAEYTDGEQVIMLPCQHMYHRPCVVEWLVRRPECPLCKQDVRVLVLEQQAQRNPLLGAAPPTPPTPSDLSALSAAEAGLSSAFIGASGASGVSVAPFAMPTEGAATATAGTITTAPAPSASAVEQEETRTLTRPESYV